MRAPGTPSRSQTADEILDRAEALIQTRGYSAFSYQDIADALDIRKASIHYHFPSKPELGIAVVERYANRFAAALAEIAGDASQPSLAMLDRYLQPYIELAATPDKVCLCGALAGEMLALPRGLRARVDRFFEQHQGWLAGILEQGAARGEIAPTNPPIEMARLIFAALQGALLVKRTTGDASQLQDVVKVLRAHIARPRDRSH